jgi:hypothetical protein
VHDQGCQPGLLEFGLKPLVALQGRTVVRGAPGRAGGPDCVRDVLDGRPRRTASNDEMAPALAQFAVERANGGAEKCRAAWRSCQPRFERAIDDEQRENGAMRSGRGKTGVVVQAQVAHEAIDERPVRHDPAFRSRGGLLPDGGMLRRWQAARYIFGSRKQATWNG